MSTILKSQIPVTVDSSYFIQLIGSSMPQTFAKVAESILIKLCSSHAKDIHIFFDRYLTPSNKDSYIITVPTYEHT